jgi:hypothetical protein
MAGRLYITEYISATLDHNGCYVPAGMEPALAEQVVVIDVASTQSAAFDTRTKFIRIHNDAICSIAIGNNPTATVNSSRCTKDGTEFRGVYPGHKLAVIANS